MADESTDIAAVPYHIPALLGPAMQALDIHPGGIYIDCTLGGGGHSRAILAAVTAGDAKGRLLAFDQDMDAIGRAAGDPDLSGEAVTLVHGNFRHIRNFARFYGVEGRVDGILADLGVSFHHFDDPGRGFSFRWPEGALDMRMNTSAPRSAADILRDITAEDLARLLRLYGECQNAPRLARAIIAARDKAPLTTAEQLVDAVSAVIGPRFAKKELARVFQALRIEVNDEIGALRDMLTGAVRVLRPGGRLAIITYHSLEDRLVKNFMRTGSLDGVADKDFYGRVRSPLRPLGSKPVVPDAAEVEANPRSRSAKLRVAVRTDDRP